MENSYKLATFSDFINGESEARDLIYTLADEITTSVIPTKAGTTVPNKWNEVFRNNGSLYVEYQPNTTPNFNGVYKHTNGVNYPIYRINLTGDALLYVTSDNKLVEIEEAPWINDGVQNVGDPTGYEINLDASITYEDPNGLSITQQMRSDNALIAFVPNIAKPYGYDTHVLIQGFTDEVGTFVYDPSWDGFKSVGILDYDEISRFMVPSYKLRVHSQNAYYSYHGRDDRFAQLSTVLKQYTFSKLSYTAKPVLHEPGRVVLESIPDVPVGITPRSYYVMLEQRMDDFNYIDVSYGVGFSVISDAVGDPKDSFTGICDPNTVTKEGVVPTIINQLAAHSYYKKALAGTPAFTAAKIKWELDSTGTKEMKSPKAHFFTGRDSTTSWVINKERRPDYLVRYWMSVNNNRVALVLEGDPAPSITDYYRGFAYIGKITPFNEYDHAGNFALTVGMGDLQADKTGFVEADIKEDTPEYGAWGEYTSNGMWSVSMFNTRSNVFFQAHHPAFLTQLPDYNVGTLPASLKRLILDKDRFQPSIWTSKYHGSPIYMVHRAEGYRGFMDGVVVVEDHNIVNGDELVVDTYILKDELDPSKGTWVEVYKFFSCTTPVNLFTKYSPAPGKVSVAILKEMR